MPSSPQADAASRIDWSVVSVDSTVRRAPQHAAGARRRPARVPGRRRCPTADRSDEAVGRSRGGLTTKIHLASDGSRRPLSVLITPGQWGDAPQLITVLDRTRVPRPAGGRPRTKPDHVCGGKAYSSRRNRQYLRRRQVQHTIPERRDQRANRRRRGSRGGRPTAFDQSRYARRNEVERCINALKGSRAVVSWFSITPQLWSRSRSLRGPIGQGLGGERDPGDQDARRNGRSLPRSGGGAQTVRGRRPRTAPVPTAGGTSMSLPGRSTAVRPAGHLTRSAAGQPARGRDGSPGPHRPDGSGQ